MKLSFCLVWTFISKIFFLLSFTELFNFFLREDNVIDLPAMFALSCSSRQTLLENVRSELVSFEYVFTFYFDSWKPLAAHLGFYLFR